MFSGVEGAAVVERAEAGAAAGGLAGVDLHRGVVGGGQGQQGRLLQRLGRALAHRRLVHAPAPNHIHRNQDRIQTYMDPILPYLIASYLGCARDS